MNCGSSFAGTVRCQYWTLSRDCMIVLTPCNDLSVVTREAAIRWCSGSRTPEVIRAVRQEVRAYRLSVTVAHCQSSISMVLTRL